MMPSRYDQAQAAISDFDLVISLSSHPPFVIQDDNIDESEKVQVLEDTKNESRVEYTVRILDSLEHWHSLAPASAQSICNSDDAQCFSCLLHPG
jgi:hypothetical protein